MLPISIGARYCLVFNQPPVCQPTTFFNQPHFSANRIFNQPPVFQPTALFSTDHLIRSRGVGVEQLQVQVMDRSKQLLSTKHPDTLTSMANITSTYCYNFKQFR
ncbi:hypothetical protein BYT27DRAFT_7258563 [Phlegmacium glaucopus]|nr:hypothetical protein BYT27DRAFT_7258563 [Phlegmacium glaucopus]